MAYETKSSDVNRMFGAIAPKYDLANSVLSLGIHHLWRRSLVRLVSAQPSSAVSGPLRVLDLCTGTGDLLPILQHRFGEVIGADFCLPMLQAGLSRGGYPRVQADALSLPFASESFDIITVAFGVRNFERLKDGLVEIRRVLKPGGHLLVLEFGQPFVPLFGTIFNLYSKFVMPLIGGLLTGNREAYKYLPRTAATFPCGNTFCNILSEAGYQPEQTRALTGGIAYAYSATRLPTNS